MSTNSDPISDRSLLRFAEEVREQFGFLKSLGFRIKRSEPTLVRFKGAEIAIDVYHGPRTFEIGLEIESLREPEDNYSIEQIIRLHNPNAAKQYRHFMTRTTSGVAEGVRRLAEDFRKCIENGILKDKNLFERLKSQNDEYVKNYALEIRLEHARERVEIAWQKKDYPAFIKTLKPLSVALSVLELRKLDYAENHSRH